MATNILNQAGKGDAPRSCFSKEFRAEYDRIFGNRETRHCPHGLLIGECCDACRAAMKPSHGSVKINHRETTDFAKQDPKHRS